MILVSLCLLNPIGFIRASVDAAVQYINLGKTRRALTIYVHALTAVNDATTATISDDVRIMLLLHYAEALALCGDDIKRYESSKSPPCYSSLRYSIACSSTKKHGALRKILKAHNSDQRLPESALESRSYNDQHWRPKYFH